MRNAQRDHAFRVQAAASAQGATVLTLRENLVAGYGRIHYAGQHLAAEVAALVAKQATQPA